MKILFVLSPLLNTLVGNKQTRDSLSVGHYMVYRERSIDLGVGYLAAVLEQEGHKVKIFDCDIEGVGSTGLKNIFRKENPDLVAISGATENRFESFKIADISKEILPDVPVIYGGIHATFTAEDTLKNIRSIDYIIRGEGEIPIVQFVSSLEKRDLADVKNLSFRKEDKIIHNPLVKVISNLDDIPFPARHLFPLEKYKREFLDNVESGQTVTPFLTKKDKTVTVMITSRGCPNKCVYCSNSAMRPDVRFRSPNNVLDEIEEIIEKEKIHNFSFADDTLTLDRKHLKGIIDGIKSRKLDITWRCNLRVGSVDRDILNKMKKVGCGYVAYGIESGSQNVLKSIGKKITVQQAKDFTKLLSELDFFSRAFFMFGLPNETFEDAMETVNLIEHLKPVLPDMWLSFGTLIFPGTPLEVFAKQKGYLSSDFSWSKPYVNKVDLKGYNTTTPILIQPQLGCLELEKIQKVLIERGIVSFS
ncbi:MAG: B12-binding domain-containing radical SAM protein [Nanoarchaeota archaeon]|nr:B12-binding domain-containing radical SAM protein [Nanoarchaeota archaeon]